MSRAFRDYSNQKILRDEHGRHAQTKAIFRLLGLEVSKLPKEGRPLREIQGILVYVRPYLDRGDFSKSSEHRVRALCPHCSKDVSAGRLFQHVPACKNNPDASPKEVKGPSYVFQVPSFFNKA